MFELMYEEPYLEIVELTCCDIITDSPNDTGLIDDEVDNDPEFGNGGRIF